MIAMAEKDLIPGTVKTRLICGRYFSAILRISDSRFALHNASESICERIMRSFSA
jgi:hypothetical protein